MVAVMSRRRRTVLSRRRRAVAFVAAVVALVAAGAPAVQLRLDEGPRRLASVGTLWRAEDGAWVLELDGSARPAAALRALRASGVQHLAAVVLASDEPAGREVVGVLARRLRVDDVVRTARAPPDPVRRSGPAV
jgi:hypothetical protein